MFGKISKDLRGGRDFMLEIVSLGKMALKYAVGRLKNDQEVVFKATSQKRTIRQC